MEEDINISSEPAQKESMFPPFILVALVIVGIIVVIFILLRFDNGQSSSFNIPTDTNHVILYDNNTLYAFEPVSGELKELGTFLLEGGEINEAALSSDLVSILLSSSGSILQFTSFTSGEVIGTSAGKIKDIAISNKLVLFSSGELNDRNERSVYKIQDKKIEIFDLGSTPFFLNDGAYAALGTSDGFRLFDFEFGDYLDTETPTIPVASTIQPSRSGNKIALVSTNNSVHIYSVLSLRPLSLLEDFFLVIPGVYDAAVSDDGRIALLKRLNERTYISVWTSNNKELLSKELPVSKNARMLLWSK